MPALDNPRWERLAQAIVEGLANGDRKPYSQGRAYIAAGYTAKDAGKRGGSAECAASRLLNRVKPILERVRELQAIAARNAAETAEKMARELNEIQYEARADKAHAAAVSAVLGKAKVLNITVEKHELINSNAPPANSDEIAIALLADVGIASPDEDAKKRALEAYDTMIATLEQITIDPRERWQAAPALRAPDRDSKELSCWRATTPTQSRRSSRRRCRYK